MKTVIRYDLYFSRNEGKPFLHKATMVYKGEKQLHSHETTVAPKYGFELAEMFEDFRTFLHEEADESEIFCNRVESCKYMSVTKAWEG